jgi:hypothetical protein
MIAIYRQAFACLAQYWTYYILMALTFEVTTGVFQNVFWVSALSMLFYISFCYAIYRYVMTDTPPMMPGFGPRSGGKTMIWGFSLAVILIFAATLTMVVLLVAALTIIGDLMGFESLLSGDAGAITSDPAVLVGLYGVIFLLIHGLTLSILGTALPASAVGDPFGVRVTLHRARRTFWPVAVGLLITVGPLCLLAFAARVFLPLQTGVLIDMRDASGALSLPGLALGILLQAGNFLYTTLGIIVLSNAYKSTLPAAHDDLAETFA